MVWRCCFFLLPLQSFTIKISDRKNFKRICVKILNKHNIIKKCHNFIYFCVYACHKSALNVRIKYNLRLLEREQDDRKKCTKYTYTPNQKKGTERTFTRIHTFYKKKWKFFVHFISRMPELTKQMRHHQPP